MKRFKDGISKFDLIGPMPQLLVFNKKRYQSFLSSFISILIIIFSLIFAIFSLREYLKFESPIISYSKANDEKTIRRIDIKDTPLMFQLVDSNTYFGVDNSIGYFKGNYEIIYDNETFENIDLSIEKCEFGKNIDMKYKEFVEKKNKFGRNIDDFYCIGFNNKNISLFFHPNRICSY